MMLQQQNQQPNQAASPMMVEDAPQDGLNGNLAPEDAPLTMEEQQVQF
jgi:hypothetical protein